MINNKDYDLFTRFAKNLYFTYVEDIVRISSWLQFELVSTGIAHQKSFGGWPKNTYDDTWNPFNIFGVTHKKNSFL